MRYCNYGAREGVVSEETLLRAEEITAIRFKKGLDKLTIVVVLIMRADNDKPISGERIVKKETR